MTGIEEGNRSQGWITFIAVLFGIAGGFNLIEGLAAIADDRRLDESQMLTGNLTLLGILLLITAGLQLFASYLVAKRNANGQALGITLCVFGILTHMAFVSVYPLWSLLVIGVDVAIIYGLCVQDRYFH